MPKASVTLGDSNSSWSKTGIKASEKKKKRGKRNTLRKVWSKANFSRHWPYRKMKQQTHKLQQILRRRKQKGSILKAGLHLGPDCGLWSISPVSMETTYQLENQAPRRKSPSTLHRLKEYLNYLCNWIESYSILFILLCLLGYDHRPVDNCPLLTT